MLIDSEVSLTNSKNVTATAVQNACLPKWVIQQFNKTKLSARRQGRRTLTPNRYTLATLSNAFCGKLLPPLVLGMNIRKQIMGDQNGHY